MKSRVVNQLEKINFYRNLGEGTIAHEHEAFDANFCHYYKSMKWFFLPQSPLFYSTYKACLQKLGAQ